jgi:hypothetical protein
VPLLTGFLRPRPLRGSFSSTDIEQANGDCNTRLALLSPILLAAAGLLIAAREHGGVEPWAGFAAVGCIGASFGCWMLAVIQSPRRPWQMRGRDAPKIAQQVAAVNNKKILTSIAGLALIVGAVAAVVATFEAF